MPKSKRQTSERGEGRDTPPSTQRSRRRKLDQTASKAVFTQSRGEGRNTPAEITPPRNASGFLPWWAGALVLFSVLLLVVAGARDGPPVREPRAADVLLLQSPLPADFDTRGLKSLCDQSSPAVCAIVPELSELQHQLHQDGNHFRMLTSIFTEVYSHIVVASRDRNCSHFPQLRQGLRRAERQLRHNEKSLVATRERYNTTRNEVLRYYDHLKSTRAQEDKDADGRMWHKDMFRIFRNANQTEEYQRITSFITETEGLERAMQVGTSSLGMDCRRHARLGQDLGDYADEVERWDEQFHGQADHQAACPAAAMQGIEEMEGRFLRIMEQPEVER